jgi:hypothetical protein
VVSVVLMATAALGQMGGGANSATEQKLAAMEKDLWEAWKNHDAEPFKKNMSDDSVNVNMGGVEGTAEVVKEISEPLCKVTSYSLSDTKFTWLDKNTALMTYKATQDVTCGDQKQPDTVWASSVWMKKGKDWKAVFHQETPAAKSE